MSTQHTPTPWRVEVSAEDSRVTVRDAEGMLVADCSGNDIPEAVGEVTHAEAIANAAFIVRAVNSHSELVAELKAMTDAYAKAMKDAGVTHYPEALAVVRQARQALSRATT